MGDLDDAIREHLELKRRRGADPEEVARQEQEALAPVTRSHPIVAVPPPYEPELRLVEDDETDAQHENGAAHADDDLGDATQEFRVESTEGWFDEVGEA